MANPVGRPKSDVETEVVAVRISTALRKRLDRYVDLETSHGQGAKFSRNSVIGYAIQFFLDAQDQKQNKTRQESQRPSTPLPTPKETTRPRFPFYSSRRKKIIHLLQQHSEGLSPAQARKLLDEKEDLGSTMKGMERDGLLRRLEVGRYVVAEGIEIPERKG